MRERELLEKERWFEDRLLRAKNLREVENMQTILRRVRNELSYVRRKGLA